MYYHVTGEITLVIEADTPEQALAEANQWGHESVFDFRNLEVE